jgi:hypothetical protein
MRYLLFLVPALLFAQDFRGTILGRVTDSSGAVVVNASIRITNTATQVAIETKSNSEGNYQAPFLLPGIYEVSVEAVGFKRLNRQNIRVSVESRMTLDFSLEVGAATEMITVTGEAPPLNTVNADVGVAVNREYVDRITTNVRRNASSLAALAAGFTGSDFNSGATDLSNVAVAISGGGGKRGVIEYMVDGVPNITGGGGPYTFVPSIDTVDEVKVQTTLFDAAYGHSNGGAVNITTRGGTNEPHGAAYIYRRWTALNATDWTINRVSQPRPPDDFRLWGFAVGGPVLLPKLYNGRNRTFFSVSLERERTHFPQNFLAHMPTALERTGDFSETLNRVGRGPVAIYDPQTTVVDSSGNATRQPFPGARVPTTRQSPIGQAVLNRFPLPNQEGTSQIGAFNWSRSAPLNFDQKQYTVRIDHKVNDRNRLFARYSRPKRDQITLPSFVGEAQLNRLQRNFVSGALDDSFILSPSFVGSVRYGYARFLSLTESGVGLDPADLRVPNVIIENQVFKGYPTFTLGENMRTVGSGRSGFTRDLHSLLASLTKLTGNHSLKFGTDYRILRINNYTTGGGSTGTFTFSPGFTQANPFQPASADTSGTAMASLLLGVASGGSLGFTSPVSVQSHYLGAYVQDDWKVTPWLTLNFGLRYEIETPYTERYNRVSYGFDSGAQFPIQVPGLDLKGGLLFAGVDGRSRREGTVDRNNFGPRFGFALSVNSRTVLRGGYGVFFSSLAYNNGFLGDSSVFGAVTEYVASLDGGATPATTLADPFPNGLQRPLGSSAGLSAEVGGSVTFYDANRVAPYNQQWQFGVQRELPFGMVLDASYVGMLTLKQLENFNLNEKPDVYLAQGSGENRAVSNPFYGVFPSHTSLGAGKTIPQRQLWLRYPQFTTVSLQGANTGRAVYHALQSNLSKRLSHNLTFNASYAWSKLMTTNTTSLVNERHYRSIGAIDQPHILRISALYELPFRVQSRVLKLLAEGWRIDGFVQLESGVPLGISQANGRPIRLRDPSIDSPIGERLGDRRDASGRIVNPYFDTTAFQALANQYTVSPEPPLLAELRAPGWAVVNSGIGKTVTIREPFKLEIRAQAWNLLNSPLFGPPGTNMSNAATFGVITTLLTDGDARRVEGSLRISF